MPKTATVLTEVAVLGAGPGGYTAAFRAADLGKKVVLIERYPALGGVCLNVGCIPSKALLHVARVLNELRDLRDQGIALEVPRPGAAQLRRWSEGIVRKLADGLRVLAARRGVEVITGLGRFTGPRAMAVQTAEGLVSVEFEYAVIAAGSQALRLPGLPEDPRILDSTAALRLAFLPKRLLVVGGGIVGLEMATVYEALGCEVTVVEMKDQLLPGCDPDIVRPLHQRLAARGTGIHLGSRVARIEPTAEALLVTLEGEAAARGEYDAVLVAVGRRPNGHEIGAPLAGVYVDRRGFIPVDDRQRTNVPHILAIGDIAGEPMLAHKAVHEGKVAAEVIAGQKASLEDRVIPCVAYTDPEVAWVGLTETQAKERGMAYGKGVFPWAASGRSLTLGREEGLTKLLFDADSRRLIGMAAVGPHAGDLVAEAALAIEMGADAEDIALTVHPHPTLAETVMMAAEVYSGTVTDLYLSGRPR